MKVINLWGSPGTGKSTTAAGLFFLMKHLSKKVELAREYAKDVVWEKRFHMFDHQNYIFAKQTQRLNILRSLDWVVTDCPLMLSSYYAPDDISRHFKPFVKDVFDSFDNVNIFLTRTKPYDPMGRMQNEMESDAISKELEAFLKLHCIEYFKIEANDEAPEKILKLVL